MLSRPDYLAHITVLASFLCWYEKETPNAIWGSRKVRDAVNSLAAIMGVDAATLRERMLLDDPKPGDDRHD